VRASGGGAVDSLDASRTFHGIRMRGFYEDPRNASKANIDHRRFLSTLKKTRHLLALGMQSAFTLA
jgi:hypothetical protein